MKTLYGFQMKVRSWIAEVKVLSLTFIMAKYSTRRLYVNHLVVKFGNEHGRDGKESGKCDMTFFSLLLN